MECKLFYLLLELLLIILLFILTIWNVNFLDCTLVFQLSFMFYINYMECKSATLMINYIQNPCFILTIWNVNDLQGEKYNLDMFEFYINYMECK